MKMRGEITVFLSLTIVCILSLFMGLLESARTAGARLYLQMAANSAMDSVMSQYNRNLWDMYHLLFLESESEDAIGQFFETYLEYYLEQENWYPMNLEHAEIMETVTMTENGGEALEKEILDYVQYRLPDVAVNLGGLAEEAEAAEKVRDFRYLFEVCEQAGRKTGKLEKSRKKVEESLCEMKSLSEAAIEAAENQQENLVRKCVRELLKEIEDFPRLVDKYEKEVSKISEYRNELEKSSETEIEDSEVSKQLQQELSAYGQVEDAAKEQLNRYREYEERMDNSTAELEEAIDILESADESEEYGEENGPDWESVVECLESVDIPGASVCGPENKEKASALERVEELFSGNLLDLVLPENAEISQKRVSLSGIPSKMTETYKTTETCRATGSSAAIGSLLQEGLVNEYCLLSFDSFLEQNQEGENSKEQPLLYEQEYLLCGNASDRENLGGIAEKLLLIRGAMNLTYLLGAPERKAEADHLAAAVSGGNIPVQIIMSFFIMAIWAFGEAIWDVKCLFAGGGVPFWKTTSTWNLELEELLSLKFLEDVDGENSRGRNYGDYMRILYFLQDRETRNYRMMDVIQWNVRTVQDDFSVVDCYSRVKVRAEVTNRHVFAMKKEYIRTVETEGVY